MLVFALVLIAGLAGAQEHHHDMSGMYGAHPMTREATGTSWQPDSSPHEGLVGSLGEWSWMAHGYASAVYDRQGGPRGGAKAFGSGMGMFTAQRSAGPGTLGARAMISLDPAMGPQGYPLLLQTGETGDGRRPLIDRQHPHDLFMELAGTYSLPVGDESSVFGYVGLPGEPALGPAAFMHRFSGLYLPDAPITHHWLDSTHIAYGVATLGLAGPWWKAEASAFRGREPDQYRWDLEAPKLDSCSGRLTVNPSSDWSMQASYGRLKSPEQLEPGVDTGRFTISATYNRPLGDGNWQTTFAYGRNMNRPGRDLDAFLLESAVRFGKHVVFGRAERVDKDELFPEGEPEAGRTFSVARLDLGYLYDLLRAGPSVWSVGASGGVHVLPAGLRTAYGPLPGSFFAFLRARLGAD